MLLYTLLASVLIFLLVNYRHNRHRLRRIEQKLDKQEKLVLSTDQNRRYWDALLGVLEPRAPLPQFSTATLDPESVVAIVSHILATRPRQILILGASPLALVCGYLSDVICIEQNPLQADVLRTEGALHGLKLEVREHPLRIQEHGTPWYAGELPHGADLVIVDGPSPFIGKDVRIPALTKFKAKQMILTAVDCENCIEGLEIRGRIGLGPVAQVGLTSRDVEANIVP